MTNATFGDTRRMHRRRGKDQHRHRLVQERDGKRHPQEQRRHAERHLQRDGGEQHKGAGARRPLFHRARDVECVQQRADKDRIGEYAVFELHGKLVLEKISPQRRVEEQPRRLRRETAVDQRPGVVHIAGAQSGDEGAEIDFRQHQNEETDGGGADAGHLPALPRMRRRIGSGKPPIAQALRGPDERDIDRTGEDEMGGEAVLRDFDAIGEAGGDHPPADDALQRAKPEDEPKPRAQNRRHPAAPEEPQKRKRNATPISRPMQPMRPFPPIDRLELGEAHAGVLSARYCGMA